MTRSFPLALLLQLSAAVALAQGTEETPPAEGAAPPAAEQPAAEQPATAVQPTPPPAAAAPLTQEDLERLRSDIKAELREEMRAEVERAAREAAQEKRAAQEWEEESWVEEIRPKLNFVDFDGYFRTRVDLFQRAHLGTYDPDCVTDAAGRPCHTGTSNFAPPLNYAYPDDRHDTMTSANMRLRLDPTLNVSEDIRIRMTADVFDNLVLGSTPDTLPGVVNNPNNPLAAFAQSQLAPERGFNSFSDSIRIRRVWGEVNTPVGQLRFGRMASHFGLGILANDGNCLECDTGNNADRIMFITRVLGHYIIPIWEFTNSGPTGRGGGPGVNPPQLFAVNEGGQPYDLDPRDDVRSWILAVARRDSPADIKEKLANGGFVINYGAYGVYRLQYYDIPQWYVAGVGTQAQDAQIIERNAWAAIGSVWGLFQWRKLKIEFEMAGIYGHISNIQSVGGKRNSDIIYTETQPDGSFVERTPHCYGIPGPSAFSKRGGPRIGEAGYSYQNVRFPPDPSSGYLDLGEGVCLRQFGFALEGSYSFLNDSLVIGGGLGYASGDDAPGFGARPGANNFSNPQRGDLDGRQFGGTMPDGTKDNTIENYRFNSDYRVDMLMFREVVGTVTDAAYVKPSITYYVLEGLGVRGDVIGAVAQYNTSTPGESNLLGAEVDGSVFYKSEDGFYGGFTYAFFLPLQGFHHVKVDDGTGNLVYSNVSRDPTAQSRYGEAKFAQRFHGILGIQF
ncbi:MAG: TIGR04551 family protein [Myxococcota bacterium]